MRTGATGQSLAGSGEQHATCSPPSLSAQVRPPPEAQAKVTSSREPSRLASAHCPPPGLAGMEPPSPPSPACAVAHTEHAAEGGSCCQRAVPVRRPPGLALLPKRQGTSSLARSWAVSRPLPGRTPSPVLCVPRLRTLPGTARLLWPSLLTPSLPLHVVSKPLPTSTSICLKTHSFLPAAGRLSRAL